MLIRLCEYTDYSVLLLLANKKQVFFSEDVGDQAFS